MNRQNFTGLPGYHHIIFFPTDYLAVAEKAWPTIVFLHGAAERGNDLDVVTTQGLPRRLTEQQNFPFVTIVPQCPRGEIWIPSMVDELIGMVQDKFRIDADRIYLTGISMGGFGTWMTAVDFPDRFAAIVPICGGGDPSKVSLIGHLPVWAFHGAKDEIVNVSETIRMVNALKKIGGDVRFTMYPEGKHDAWTETYNNPALYEWLLTHNRRDLVLRRAAS